ncbi:hypothetical protein [Pseudophaeobacter sp.]|uniref:hypothetical protein n=1 Tax=Pseudophaeobacter sp. TaxID=1971739 RepID=UPI002621E0CD|nr:hypothetical protein [Pseudophaeobacter sp.]
MNERENLLARAKELNITHPANIGDDKLKAKIAEAKADAVENGEADPVDLVVVKGPERGRWRIGRKFTREATEIPLEDLDEDQLEALQNDPELIVSFS